MANPKWKTTLALAVAMVPLTLAGIANAMEFMSPDSGDDGPKLRDTNPVTKTIDPDLSSIVRDGEAEPISPDAHLRFAYHGPSEDLCLKTSGEVARRRACRPGELSTDPSALRLCASRGGAVSVKAALCGDGEQDVDLRRLHRSSPASFFPQLASPSGAFEATTPTPLEVLDMGEAPRRRRELCRTSQDRVRLRSVCPKGESPLHPTGLTACVDRSSRVIVRGLACAKGESALNLRALRGLGPEIVGFGPTVGLFPSLADLAADYPQGPGA